MVHSTLYQRYSYSYIHGRVGATNAITVPLVFALMTRKNEECYQRLIQDLCELASEQNVVLQPKYIITDFEVAAMDAYRNEFDSVQQKACLFHFGQNIYRQFQKLGLASRYNSDSDFSLKARQFLALAFLSADEIPQAFGLLKATLPKELEQFANWFEENYVLGRIRKKNPKIRSQ